jgi:hypothetical protein
VTIGKLLIAGVDGCRGGWIAFKVDLPARATSVEVVDLAVWVRKRRLISPASASTFKSGCSKVRWRAIRVLGSSSVKVTGFSPKTVA